MLARLLSRFFRVRVKDDIFLFEQNIPWDIQQEAGELRDSLLSELRFQSLLRRDSIPDFLVSKGILVENYKEEINRVETQIELTLMALFQNYVSTVERGKNKRRLADLRDLQHKYQNAIAQYDCMTLEYLGDEVYDDYVVSARTTLNGSPIPTESVHTFKSSYRQLLPSGVQLREMARSDRWRTLWLSKGADLFTILPMTDYQMMLAAFSRMYENIYQHPECPSNEVINDDDALDGWFLTQSKKSSQKVDTSKSPTSETLIFTNDPDEINAINAANSTEAKLIKKTREAQLLKQGKVRYEDFSDIKQRAMTNARQSSR